MFSRTAGVQCTRSVIFFHKLISFAKTVNLFWWFKSLNRRFKVVFARRGRAVRAKRDFFSWKVAKLNFKGGLWSNICCYDQPFSHYCVCNENWGNWKFTQNLPWANLKIVLRFLYLGPSPAASRPAKGKKSKLFWIHYRVWYNWKFRYIVCTK